MSLNLNLGIPENNLTLAELPMNRLPALAAASCMTLAATALAEDAPAPASPISTTAPQNTMTTQSQPAAPDSKPAAFESLETNGRKYVLVCSIKTVEANRQFQQNVTIVQNQLAQVKRLQQRIEEALTLVEKEALKKVLDETNKSLEQNNAVMAKTYGFSILRQYLVEVGKTRLYTPITDKEYDEAKTKPDFKEDNFLKNENGRFAHIATISGVAENNIFRQNVQLVQAQRNRLVQLKAAIDQTKEADAKKKLEEEFKKSEETLIKNNEEMSKSYGFSLVRNYVMEIEEAKLYMAVTDEEFAKQKEEAEKKSPAK